MEDRDERKGGRELEECTKEEEQGVRARGKGHTPAPRRSHDHMPSSWIPLPHAILVDPVARSRAVRRI
jgi:hypothetical protein